MFMNRTVPRCNWLIIFMKTIFIGQKIVKQCLVLFDLLNLMDRFGIILGVRERVYTGRTRTKYKVVAAHCPSQF